jgi:hypothetical protein
MRRLAALLAPLLAAACATLDTAPSARLESAVPAQRECAEWFRDLDVRVAAAGLRDAQDRRLAGFPYLRVNRLLASFRGDAGRDAAAMRALVDRMQALDLEGRAYEMANLPAAPGALARARDCGDRLKAADVADAAARASLLERAVVPDNYSTAMRLFGLYGLTRIPFGAGVSRYQAQVRAAHRAPLETPAQATVLTVAPAVGAPLARGEVAAILRRASGNALRIPEPDAAALERLFATYAPIIEIEVAGDDDRPGALAWAEDLRTPVVDASRLAVYRLAAWTRDGERSLLQLTYTIWFPRRLPESGVDLLAGELDGVVWRVTLAPDGEPLVYDTIHPCGCFHLFYPTPLAVPRAAPAGEPEWMLAPQALPRIADGERVRLRIATRTHYVERVTPVREGRADARYALQPYGELRSLPVPGGGRRSVFGPDGLIAGTERPERFFFWPMGICSAGAMRQWGHHATAFIGRRQFDDADLLDKRFVLALP